jgi:hypothetical protein
MFAACSCRYDGTMTELSSPVTPRVRFLGPVVRLQIQTGEVKVGERGHRVYNPAPIRPVPYLLLGPGGFVGPGADGHDILDIHHRDHPSGKWTPKNGICILFTRHYELMRARFGDHIIDGIAGESILVESDRQITVEDLQHGLAIQAAGGVALLHDLVVAPPCVEYTRFALQYPPEAHADARFKDALKFLLPGMRGFYAHYDGQPLTVRLGDQMGLPDPGSS